MRHFIFGILALILSSIAPAVFADVLDINAATLEQFDQVMIGVGKVKAEIILHDREKNGPFKSVDDLVRVKGIGPATVKKNRAKITVGSAAQAVQSATAQPAPERAK
ncbi:ComEA family DNA-binding protein [Methylomagnum sp.]